MFSSASSFNVAFEVVYDCGPANVDNESLLLQEILNASAVLMFNHYLCKWPSIASARHETCCLYLQKYVGDIYEFMCT